MRIFKKWTFLFLQYLNILFQKYWYYLNNSNTDENQPAFQVNFFFNHVIVLFIRIVFLRLILILYWNGAWTDQARNNKAMKEMASIYSSSEKHKPLCPSQILMSKKLVEEVIRALEEGYINPFSILVDECCFSIPPEKIRKPLGFLMFSWGIQKQVCFI